MKKKLFGRAASKTTLIKIKIGPAEECCLNKKIHSTLNKYQRWKCCQICIIDGVEKPNELVSEAEVVDIACAKIEVYVVYIESTVKGEKGKRNVQRGNC